MANTAPTPYGWNPLYEPRIADADPNDLRQQIFDEGLRLRWEKASRCACNYVQRDQGGDSAYDITTTKEGDPDCPECHGVGYLYYHAQEIKALVHDTSADPTWLKIYGELMDGSVAITLLPEHVPGPRDRFVCLDQWRRYSEQRPHATNPEALTYPVLVVPTVVGTAGDPTLPASIDLGILNARRADANGHITDDPMVVGTDIDVTADGEVEYLDAGSYATGSFVIAASVPNGTMFPIDTPIYLLGFDYGYRATTTGVFYDGLCAVQAIATVVGSGMNRSVGFEFPFYMPDESVAQAEVIVAFTGGTNPGEGGNIPAVGEMVAFDYYCRPCYVVRKFPHYSREAYVVQTPYVNGSSGDRGFWDPADGTFPTGAISRGDYFEVQGDDTVDGVTFATGEVLLALVDTPSETAYAGQWLRLVPGVNEAKLVKLSSMVLCWLEDLGDPFARSGVTS